MGWGAMMGLGQGLQQVGGMLSDMNKEKMREQLALQREERAALRNRLTPKGKEYVQRDGVWFEQILGGEMNVLEERLAPENKVKEFTAAAEERAAQAEKRALDAKKAEQDIEWGAGREARDERDFAAREAQRKDASARGWASVNNRGSRGLDDVDTEPSREEIVSLVTKENKATFDALAKKYPEVAKSTDFQRMVRRAVDDGFYARGINPNEALQDILNEYENELINRAGASSSGSSGNRIPLTGGR